MRFRSVIPYVFVALVLALMGWAGYKDLSHPTLGLYWGYSSGLVYQNDGNNPGVAGIEIGDRLISGNGLEAKSVYKLIDQGEVKTIRLQFERKGTIFSVDADLIKPALGTVIGRMSVFLIAFCFWLTGSLIYAFGQDTEQAILFLFFSLFTSVTLSAGSISSFGPEWLKVLLFLGIIWCGFFAIHLHLNFPAKLNIQNRTMVLRVLFAVSIGLSFLFSVGSVLHADTTIISSLWTIGLITFGVEMLAVMLILGNSFFRSSSVLERTRAGIVVLTVIFGVLPVLFFSIIPELVIGRTILPYEISFLSLLLFPLGYGYAIMRYRIVSLDSTINRGATLAFLMLLMAGFYSLAFLVLAHFAPGIYDQFPFAGMVVTILIAGFSNRLYTYLFALINRVLYGEWYDYQSAVNFISKNLKSVESDDQIIASTFCQVVAKSLQLEFMGVILHNKCLTLYEANYPVTTHQIPDEIFNQAWGQMVTMELFGVGSKHLSQNNLAKVFSERLASKTQLVMPLQGKDQVLGILVLGRKRGGGILETSDMDVLEVAIHQAQISMEKARLLEDVQENSREIRELHFQVLNAQDEERKKLARELHDQIIQSLIGLNHQISKLRRRSDDKFGNEFDTTQNELSTIIREVRQICDDLRPPVLDNVGLVSAIRSKIDEVQKKEAFHIRFILEGNEDQDIPERTRMFAYRVLLESLANIHKHADAEFVEVRLKITMDELQISVMDNGKGFAVPGKLGTLEKEHHFGLVSLLEDARDLKGNFEIQSAKGGGCSLVATVPLG